jgi:hypothetical protein
MILSSPRNGIAKNNKIENNKSPLESPIRYFTIGLEKTSLTWGGDAVVFNTTIAGINSNSKMKSKRVFQVQLWGRIKPPGERMSSSTKIFLREISMTTKERT